MSVYIKGMEMPTRCYDCPCANGDRMRCQVAKRDFGFFEDTRPDWCPLTPSAGSTPVVGAKMFKVLQLSKLPDQLLNLALAYANNMIEYGVDVTEKWDTATRQQAELEAAFLKGRRYERKRLLSSPEKRTNADSIRGMTDVELAKTLSVQIAGLTGSKARWR